MKRFTLIACLLLTYLCAAQAKDRVFERPPFIAWSSTSIEIDKIVAKDTATVVHIKAYYRPKNWIKIATGSFLKDNNGAIYPIRRGVGITLDKEFWMPESGEAEFELIFPPIPYNIKSLDFSEGDFDGAFKIWGIQLDEKAFRKQAIPQNVTIHKINKKTELPQPEFAYSKATLKGKVLGFQPEMPSTAKLGLNDPIRWSSFSEDITIREDGTFEFQVDVITVTPAVISLPTAEIPCLLAPGQETTVTINLPEISRRSSKLLKDSKPLGKQAYFEGYLATLQQELSENTINTNIIENPLELIKDLIGKDISGCKTYFIDKRNELFDRIESTSMSPAAKEVLKANTNITTAIGLFMGRSLVMRAHVEEHKMNREQTEEYYKNTQIELPTDYYDSLKDFSLNSTPNLYAPEYAYGILLFSSQNAIIQPLLNTDKGVLFDMGKAFQCNRSIDDFSPLSTQQLNELAALSSPAYKELLVGINKTLLQKIELNKQKGGFTINQVEDVSNEELFTSIISKFEGRVLLVDFWATWCGPCRIANKVMVPMKEELKDKDVLYVYITGETSPQGVWENMIPDIHGEHFRVSDAQWRYLMDKYEVRGVPTYYVIDRKGNTTYKQTGFPGVDVMKAQLEKALEQ